MCSEQLDKEELAFQEAADWLLVLKNAPEHLSPLDEFKQWLAASDENRRAWVSVSQTWEMLGAGAGMAEAEEIPAFVMPQTRRRGLFARMGRRSSPAGRRFRGMATAGAGLAALCTVVFLAAPTVLVQMRADYLTSAGQTEHVLLDDGSTVDLGGSSAISADLAGDRRQVALLAGEAFFDVASDAARPFIVDAHGLELRVLGTAFDVRVTSSTTTVALLHGSVEIDSASGLKRILLPGEMLELEHATGEVTIEKVSPEDIGAWREGRVFLADVTVSNVVELIQRYHTAWLSVPDSGLAAQKVSGLFDLQDPDAALAALVRPFGGKVLSVTPLARVITRL